MEIAMTLSDGDKLVLLMLCELYEKLGIVGEVDPEFIKSAIFNDQIWAIRWKYPGIPFDESEDPEVVKEVLDILDMWSYIESSYNKLPTEERERLEGEHKNAGERLKFSGFDGNNESEYMGTAMFIVNDLDRFAWFRGRSFNCHHPSLQMHRRMLGVCKPIQKQRQYELMSVGDLLQILNARTHPSNR